MRQKKLVKDFDVQGSYDFEDVVSANRIFAYVWFAYLDWEFCAALASLKILQNLRQDSEDTVEYILLIYTLGENEKNVRYKALEAWVSYGGKIAEFPIPQALTDQNHE